ncbi:MAG: Na/Pi cotransporter family protein, partial [Phycisphaeraceae bacterium]|nr:Na/Pi cotransporter family protein [Phycisphaeraceae bacterium]
MPELELWPMTIGLLGGLAFFLYGLGQMTDGLKVVAGDTLRTILGKLTTNRFTGIFTGAAVTAVIQSSSVTTVLVVGFVSAGLMTLTQSVGVIMGANIGTTITAQIIAFKVTESAMFLVIIGFGMTLATRRRTIRNLGTVILGLGMVFYGMNLMSSAASPLRTWDPFIRLMQGMENPALGILAAALFTALVQSSSATTGIVIVLASQGLISLEAGIALILGANVGTCVTALLATIGKPREAMQTAIVHVAFNLIGVCLWVGLIGPLAGLAEMISPLAADLEGTARRAAETPRQIANAHTIFNVANTLILVWFAGPLARLARRIAPDKAGPAPHQPEAQFLDDVYLSTPAMAIERVRMELGHLGECVGRMVNDAPNTVMKGKSHHLDALEQRDHEVDHLHGRITAYLGELSRQELSPTQTQQIGELIAIGNYLENIGDTIETNMVSLGRERIRDRVEISPGTREVIEPLFDTVKEAFTESVEALRTGDVERARRVIDMKDKVTDLGETATTRISQRLAADAPNRIATFRVEADLVEILKRAYYFTRHAAQS